MTILHADGQARRPENQLEEAFTRWYSERSDALGLGAVSRQASMKSDDWPGVGKVDLELLCPDRCWVEFKWSDLWNCPWDLAKLGLAVREGLCRRAYLVAAAPTGAWDDEVDGAEYFGFGQWDTHDDVILRYHRYWLKWKRDEKTRPLRLPDTILTDEVTQPKAFSVARTPWQVRMASVRSEGEGWITVDDQRQPHRLS